MPKTYSVQIAVDNYDILNNKAVREKCPTLYKEVLKHDKTTISSWYDLSEEAYREYENYVKDNRIPYVSNCRSRFQSFV